ncbi:glycoside hydrolase family 28 protein [candidate division KSB1 bacterium]|nr:glycoside hydrolase family 28 protein [candidate division KSB1 bacterium]
MFELTTYKRIGLLFIAVLLGMVPITRAAGPAAVVYNISDYGAVADGKTLNTSAIARTIEACKAKGGGTVYVPAGVYLTGPVQLCSNMTLYLDAGATLLFSTDPQHYPAIKTRWAGIMCWAHMPLVFGDSLENVAISGRGTLEGQGKVWWDRFNQAREQENYKPQNKMEEQFALLNQDIHGGYMEWARYHFRPPMIQFKNCKNVLIEGITLRNSPFWNIHPVFCRNIIIQDINIISPEKSENTDGIDIDSSSKVRITNCYIDVGDDCIVIKSGLDEDGRRVGIPTEDVVIDNCTMKHGHGGVVIGSEMSADVRNIVVSNCVFHNTDRGIRLKTRRGRGGIVENIRMGNIVMQNVTEAFTMNMHYREGTDKVTVSERTPRFRNIHLQHITAIDCQKAGNLVGLKEMPLQDIRFSDITIIAKEGITCKYVYDIDLIDVEIRNTNSPALAGEHVTNLYIDNFQAAKNENAPEITLHNSKHVSVRGCFRSMIKPFIRFSGTETTDIMITGSHQADENAIFIGDEIDHNQIRLQR